MIMQLSKGPLSTDRLEFTAAKMSSSVHNEVLSYLWTVGFVFAHDHSGPGGLPSIHSSTPVPVLESRPGSLRPAGSFFLCAIQFQGNHKGHRQRRPFPACPGTPETLRKLRLFRPTTTTTGVFMATYA